MGKKSASKKQGRNKKQAAVPAESVKESAVVQPGISLKQALKAPAKHNGLHIESAQYVRKDIRLIAVLLLCMFVTLSVLTVVNTKTGFVAEAGQHLSSFLNF